MPRPNFQFSVFSSQFAILLAFATQAFSQATFPSPTLTSVSPLGAKPGGTVELTLRGSDLDAPQSVLLNDRALPIKSLKPGLFSIKLPADLKPDLYDLRFVGRYGVSNPRVFEISTLDAITSPGSNAKPDKALKVVPDSVVEGCFKSNSPHWFTIDLKKGQSLTATFDGRRFDTRTELIGALSAPTGRELARMQGGVLAFTAASEGTYRLRFNDLMYRTGDDYSYRITLSSAPPPAPRTVVMEDVRPLQIGHGVRDYFLPLGAAQAFDLPFKAGDKFIIEVQSHQLGRPTDPHLIIENLTRDSAGKEILKPQAEVADAPAITPAPAMAVANRDPSYAYEAKADGTFRITLSDSFATTQYYELNILKETPKPPPLIALNPILPGAKAKGAELGSANVPRNGIAAFEIIVPNRNALSEPIELKAGSLPAGVTCLGGFIGKGQSLGYIAFQASADAPSGASILSGIPQSRFVSFAVADATKDNALYRTTGAPALGVSAQPAPAFVQTEKSDIFEVAADGKLEIDLKVTRHADFAEGLKLKVLGLIDPTKAPEADIPAKAATGKLTLDLKALKLPPGDYGFILQGSAKMKVQGGSEALAAAEVKLKGADEAAKKAGRERELGLAIRKNPKPGDDLEANEKALKQALEAAAQAEVDKKAASALIKDLTAKSPAKEATFIVYSNPIHIRVKEAAKK